MPNTIQIKRKTTTGAPSLSSLTDGELCLVVPDNVIYQRVNSSTLVSFLPSEVLTQADYDALATKQANTIYLING